MPKKCMCHVLCILIFCHLQDKLIAVCTLVQPTCSSCLGPAPLHLNCHLAPHPWTQQCSIHMMVTHPVKNYTGCSFTDWYQRRTTAPPCLQEIMEGILRTLLKVNLDKWLILCDIFNFSQFLWLLTLDLVITSQDVVIDNVLVQDHLGTSDHIVLVWDLIYCIKIKQYNTERRTFARGNYYAMRDWLGEVDWD